MTARLFVLIAALLAAAQAPAQPSSRAGTWELYIGPEFTDGKSYSFDGGSNANTDTGVGFNIGFAKNFDRRWAAGMDIVWAEQDYRATVSPGQGNTNPSRQISGQIDWRTIRFFGTFHLLESNFTPFVTAGLGWTYIDTNIPSGPPENLCWYYPWYGYYCSTFVPTETSTEFSYNLGGGLRLDAGRGVFRFLVNSQWVDFANYSSNVIQYRIDIGTKF